MVSEADLFNLEDPNSVIRKLVVNKESMDLRELAQRRIPIPQSYDSKKEFNILTGDSKEISSLVQEDIKKFVHEHELLRLNDKN